MKIMVELVSVLLSLNFACPVLMYYIYDDNPITGYEMNANDIGTYPKSRNYGHKKYFPGLNNPKGMKLVNERAVDSHFRISKESPVSFAAVSNMENQYTPIMRLFTDPPPQNNLAPVNSGVQKLIKKNVDIPNSEQSQSLFTKDVHMTEGFFKPNIRNNNENLNVFNEQLKQELAAPKALASMDIKKKISKMNSRRPYNAQNYFQKSLTSVKDKVLHKANINHEQNAQLMAYMLNEIAKKYLERKSQKQREYTKRDAIPLPAAVHRRVPNGQENNENVENSGSNLKDGATRGRVMTPGVGSYDLGVEINDAPYALFYRMNHENIEQSDFFTSAQNRFNVQKPINIQDDDRITVSYGKNKIRGTRRSINITDKNNKYAAFRDR